METKTSKIVSISNPTPSKVVGTNYSFVKFESGDNGAVFFKSEKFAHSVGETITYEIESKDGRTRIQLPNKNGYKPGGYSRPNNRLEALKLAVMSFNAGKIEKSGIKPMAKYLEEILSE